MTRTTADGRYIVVRGRLWRASDPGLDKDVRQALVDELMAARRAVARADRSGDAAALATARAAVDAAKRGLGERGPVWWKDGAPDLSRRMLKNTHYAREEHGVGGACSAQIDSGAASSRNVLEHRGGVAPLGVSALFDEGHVMTEAETRVRDEDIAALIAATPNLVAEVNATKEVLRRLAELVARDEEARSFLARPIIYEGAEDTELQALTDAVNTRIADIVGAPA